MAGTATHQSVSADLLITRAAWRKSRHSGAVGNCVELAPLVGDEIGVRNSRNSHGSALIYSAADMKDFLARVREGAFNGAGH